MNDDSDSLWLKWYQEVMNYYVMKKYLPLLDHCGEKRQDSHAWQDCKWESNLSVLAKIHFWMTSDASVSQFPAIKSSALLIDGFSMGNKAISEGLDGIGMICNFPLWMKT